MKILFQENGPAYNILLNGDEGVSYNHGSFIKSFRHILQKPELSRAQLASMLRNARIKDSASGRNVSIIDKLVTNCSNNNEAL
jgi:hypothetical protein